MISTGPGGGFGEQLDYEDGGSGLDGPGIDRSDNEALNVPIGLSPTPDMM